MREDLGRTKSSFRTARGLLMSQESVSAQTHLRHSTRVCIFLAACQNLGVPASERECTGSGWGHTDADVLLLEGPDVVYHSVVSLSAARSSRKRT